MIARIEPKTKTTNSYYTVEGTINNDSLLQSSDQLLKNASRDNKSLTDDEFDNYTQRLLKPSVAFNRDYIVVNEDIYEYIKKCGYSVPYPIVR